MSSPNRDGWFHVPSALADRDQWVVWRSVVKNARKTKMPYSPHFKCQARANDSRTWSSLRVAKDVCERERFDGLGFVFKADDDIFGIDLDACVSETRGATVWAARLIAAFPTYAEISPSRTGVKLFGFGRFKSDVSKVFMGPAIPGWKRPAIELYGYCHYFTVTGRRWKDSPLELADCQTSLDTLVAWMQHKRTPKAPPRRSATPMPASAERRAQAYIDKVPPTTCGTSTCHDRTFRVACMLVCEIGFSAEQAYPFLRAWADRGSHAWNDIELNHKLLDAEKKKPHNH